MKDKVRETVVRTVHRAGTILAGETGGRAANRITDKAGLGRVELCDGPGCPYCERTS
jgi:hypothetical protein